MSRQILVAGSINCDITLGVRDFPVANETVMGSSAGLKLGGKGLNQAVAAARAGASVEMIACVGGDQFATSALDYLVANSVGAAGVCRLTNVSTGTAAILVNERAENMIAVAAGANAECTPQHLTESCALLSNIGAVVVQLEVPLDTVRAALEFARARGALGIFNPAPATPEALALLPLADLVTPNESETELLTGIRPDSEGNVRRAIDRLRQLGARNVVITRGSRGCDVAWGDDFFHSPPFPVEAVDTTGAGDVFNGALAAGLVLSPQPVDENSVKRAVRRASAAAAMSVCKPFAQDAAPYAGEIDVFLAERAADEIAV